MTLPDRRDISDEEYDEIYERFDRIEHGVSSSSKIIHLVENGERLCSQWRDESRGVEMTRKPISTRPKGFMKRAASRFCSKCIDEFRERRDMEC